MWTRKCRYFVFQFYAYIVHSTWNARFVYNRQNRIEARKERGERGRKKETNQTSKSIWCTVITSKILCRGSHLCYIFTNIHYFHYCCYDCFSMICNRAKRRSEWMNMCVCFFFIPCSSFSTYTHRASIWIDGHCYIELVCIWFLKAMNKWLLYGKRACVCVCSTILAGGRAREWTRAR